MGSDYKPSQKAINYHNNLYKLKKEFPSKKFITPNWGPQTEFLLCKTRTGMYGGGAGSGKTFAGMAMQAPYIHLPWFRGVMFRREMTDVTKAGALFDESRELYVPLGGKPNDQTYKWFFKNDFPSGARIEFSHLQYLKHIYDHKGAQYCISYFDEADTFEEAMWWYINGRTRTTRCPMKAFQRGSCNPNPDSFIAPIIMPHFIDNEGFAIKERSGDIIWLARDPRTGLMHQELDENVMKNFLIDAYPDDMPYANIPKPVDFTFIHAELSDNPYLNNDGEYRSSLALLDPVEQQRQLYGNWLIKNSAGEMFQPSWIEFVDPDKVPSDIQEVRGWDLAATEDEPGKKKNSSSTSSTKLGRCKDDYCWILDNTNKKLEPNAVWEHMRDKAREDGKYCQQDAPQDGGAAGKSVIVTILKEKLAGVNWTSSPERGKKSVRFSPFSAYCFRNLDDKTKPRMVKMVKGPWNQRYINELLQFPTKGEPDDDADSTSRAFNNLFDRPDAKPSWRRNLPKR